MIKLIEIFFKSLGWYLLLTIPSLIFPPMYGMSVMICLAVCWIAGLFFIVAAQFLKQLSGKPQYKIVGLAAFAVLAVLLAFQFVEVFGLWGHIWRDESYLLFPLAALAAAWIGIYRGRHELFEYFNTQTRSLSYDMQVFSTAETVSSPENIQS